MPILAAGIVLALVLAFTGAAVNGIEHGVFRRSVALGVNLYTHSSYYLLADTASREWAFVESRLPGAKSGLRKQLSRSGIAVPASGGSLWSTDWKSDVPWPVNGLPHRLERALGSAQAAEILAADAGLAARFRSWAMERPYDYAASVINEARRLLLKCEEYYPAGPLAAWPSVPAFLVRVERGVIHPLPLVLLALAGLAALGGPRTRGALIPLAGLVAYLAPIPFAHIGFTRYSLPALPGLLALAAVGLDVLGVWSKRGAAWGWAKSLHGMALYSPCRPQIKD